MKKTITVPQNGTQETLVIVAQEANDVSEQKTSFPGIGNSIVAQEANDVSEQTISFADIRNIIVAEEAISVHEQKTSFAGIGNSIVAQEADGKYEQTTRFPGIIGNSIVAQEAISVHEQTTSFHGYIGMDSQDFINPRDQCHTIARSKEISYIRSEIPSAENKIGIISPSTGATA